MAEGKKKQRHIKLDSEGMIKGSGNSKEGIKPLGCAEESSPCTECN